MTTKNFTLLTAVFVIALIYPLAHAADAKVPISTPKHEYKNGGVGEEGLEAMRKVAKDYPLRMVFSEGVEGAYVADVVVGVYDEADQLVFYKKKAGPYLYVKLPDGDYKVVALYEGVKRSYKITLNSAESKKIFFNWQDDTVSESPTEANTGDDKD